MTKQQALATTCANELVKESADLVTSRVREWYGQDTDWTCKNEDAINMQLDFDYDYVWTNLPFGSWRHSTFPRQIARHLVKSEAILISKCNTFKKYIREVTYHEFPGIMYDVAIQHYDLNYTGHSKFWLDPYPQLTGYHFIKETEEPTGRNREIDWLHGLQRHHHSSQKLC